MNRRKGLLRGAVICAAVLIAALHAGAAPKLKGEPGGFMRIVNSGVVAAKFDYRLAIHAAPWSVRNQPFSDKPLAPGEASPWVRLAGIDPKAKPPLTVFAYLPRRVEGAAGRLEFATEASEEAIVRKLPVGEAEAVVEVMRYDFHDAGDLPTAQEIGEKTLAAVKAMAFRGKAPVRFPTGAARGTPADLEAGRLLGFTAMEGPPHRFDADSFRRLGYTYIYTYSHLISTPNKGYGYRLETNREEMTKMAAAWKETGLMDRVYRVSVYDEAAESVDKINDDPAPVISKDPNAWGQMVTMAGLAPSDFTVRGDPPPPGASPQSNEYWAKLQAVPIGAWEGDREGAMKTLRLWGAVWPVRFSNARAALHEAFGPGVRVTANIHVTQYLKLGLGLMDPWMIYASRKALDVPQVCDYFIGYPQEEEYLIDVQRCAMAGRDEPVDAYLASQSRYLPRSPRSMELRGVSALGAGARSMTFYEWGPRWGATENWFSDDPRRLEAIGRINHAAGFVEDILLDGRPPRGQAALLLSPSSDKWRFTLPAHANHAERITLHHLLRGAHYQMDYLDDEMLPPDSELDGYRVIFIAQPCMPAEAARRLLAWADRGGTLVALTAAGEMDELRRDRPLMMEAFGLKSLAWTEKADQQVGEGAAAVKFNAARLAVAVADSAVIARFANGDPAITQKPRGRGRLVFFAFSPGAAYDGGARREKDVLVGSQDSVRNLLRPFLEPAGEPLCETDNPQVGARLVRGPRGAAVFVVNSTGAPLPRVVVTLRVKGFSHAESLQHGNLDTTDGARVTLPLDLWDVIRFE